MKYIIINAPSYPYFVLAGSANYRPGDIHRKRSGIGFFDLIVVEEGTLFMEVEDGYYPVEKNGVLIIPPDQAHGGYQVCRERTQFHWMHFYSNEVFTISDMPKANKKRSSFPVTINNHDFTFSMVLPVFQILTNKQAAEILVNMRLLETISLNKFEQVGSTMKSHAGVLQQQAIALSVFSSLIVTSSDPAVDNIAYLVKQHIATHYAEKLTLGDLAKVANCHPTHVIRCMKQQYGMTPVEAITETRLQRAGELLQTTDMPVTDIAFSVGFSSSSYFCRVFKSAYKVCPQGFRAAGNR
jgi:AraC-like DNA-binding protein